MITDHDCIKCEIFIRQYIPNGWKDPIGTVILLPYLLPEELQKNVE